MENLESSRKERRTTVLSVLKKAECSHRQVEKMVPLGGVMTCLQKGNCLMPLDLQEADHQCLYQKKSLPFTLSLRSLLIKSRAAVVSLSLAFIDAVFPLLWRREVFPHLYQDNWLLKQVVVNIFDLQLEVNHQKSNLLLLRTQELIRIDFSLGSVRAFLHQEQSLAVKSLDRRSARCLW